MTDKTLASHCDQTPEDVYRELRRARAAELSEKARADRLEKDGDRLYRDYNAALAAQQAAETTAMEQTTRADWYAVVLEDERRQRRAAEADRDRLSENLDQFDAYAITVDSALRNRGEVDRLRADLRHAPEAVALWTRSAQRALDEADRLREALAKVRHPDSFGERCHCPDVCMVIDAALSPKDAP